MCCMHQLSGSSAPAHALVLKASGADRAVQKHSALDLNPILVINTILTSQPGSVFYWHGNSNLTQLWSRHHISTMSMCFSSPECMAFALMQPCFTEPFGVQRQAPRRRLRPQSSRAAPRKVRHQASRHWMLQPTVCLLPCAALFVLAVPHSANSAVHGGYAVSVHCAQMCSDTFVHMQPGGELAAFICLAHP